MNDRMGNGVGLMRLIPDEYKNYQGIFSNFLILLTYLNKDHMYEIFEILKNHILQLLM